MLVLECVKNNIPVVAVPGPSAVLTGLVVSGKDTSKFTFQGFLSNKKAKRKKQLAALKDTETTVVLYESPHRIISFLKDFQEIMGKKEVILARELTKRFEEVLRGTAEEHLGHFSEKKPKGEFVIIF